MIRTLQNLGPQHFGHLGTCARKALEDLSKQGTISSILRGVFMFTNDSTAFKSEIAFLT